MSAVVIHVLSFNLGDEAARGNFGLLDQSLALQWVQDNIDGKSMSAILYLHHLRNSSPCALVAWRMLSVTYVNDVIFIEV